MVHQILSKLIFYSTLGTTLVLIFTLLHLLSANPGAEAAFRKTWQILWKLGLFSNNQKELENVQILKTMWHHESWRYNFSSSKWSGKFVPSVATLLTTHCLQERTTNYQKHCQAKPNLFFDLLISFEHAHMFETF